MGGIYDTYLFCFAPGVRSWRADGVICSVGFLSQGFGRLVWQVGSWRVIVGDVGVTIGFDGCPLFFPSPLLCWGRVLYLFATDIARSWSWVNAMSGYR